MKPKEKIKSWSEIKLKEPGPEICKQIELLMRDKNELTASKALQSYILDYSATKAATADLRSVNMKLQDDLEQKENKLQSLQYHLAHIKDLYSKLKMAINIQFE